MMEKIQLQLEFPFFVGSYSIVAKIGFGLNSCVFKGACKTQNNEEKIVAIKIPKSLTSNNFAAIRNEYLKLSQLNHPNIMKSFFLGEDHIFQSGNEARGKTIYEVLEYANEGTLFPYLCVKNVNITAGIARYYFRQLISALDYLHSNNISHGDIKPENILLDENFQLKLADFGFSLSSTDLRGQKIFLNIGTMGYQAPEIVSGIEYDGKIADIFAAGVTLFRLLAGRCKPFEVASGKDRHYKFFYLKKTELFWDKCLQEKNCKIDPDARDLIEKMLAFLPSERINIEQIKQHCWFSLPYPPEEEIIKEMKSISQIINKTSSKQEELLKECTRVKQAEKLEVMKTKLRGYEESSHYINSSVLNYNMPVTFSLKMENYINNNYACLETEFSSLFHPQCIFVPFSEVDALKMIFIFYLDWNKENQRDFNLDNNYIVSSMIFESKEFDECNASVKIGFQILKLKNDMKVIQVRKEEGDLCLFYDVLIEFKEYIYSNFELLESN